MPKALQSQHVRDGARVPAFGEHGDGDHAADAAAEPSRLADGVHHFAQDVLVRQALCLLPVAGAVHDLAAKAVDLVRSGLAEPLVEGVAGFELAGVDEQRPGPWQRIARRIEIAEERQSTVVEGLAFAVAGCALEAGDVFVHQLRGGGVVAYDDEARGHVDVRVAPQVECLLVVPVEGIEGAFQFLGQIQRVETGFAAAFGQLLAHVVPQVAVDGHLGTRHVVHHGHAGQLDDAAFDRVHQREVADGPWEERAFLIAGPAQEERRR